MSSCFLTEEVKITTAAPTATGTTTISATGLDMAGWDGVCFVVRLGSPAVDNNIRVQQETTIGGTYADLVGTIVGNHATNNPLIIDIKRPQEQFVRCQVTRGTTTTIDSLVAIQYRGRTKGQAQPSGTQIERWSWLAEGTA
jgi:hypothetical protein